MTDSAVPRDAARPVYREATGPARMYFLQLAPWLVLAMLTGFIALNVVGDGVSDSGRQMGRALTLGGLAIVTAVWFIACFTGDADSKLRHGFVFAYAFTFGAFALLLTPFVGADANTSTAATETAAAGAVRPREGVLQLVRGCIVAEAEFGMQASAATRCPQPASALGDTFAGPVTSSAWQARKEVARQFAWLVSVGGVTVRKYRSLLDEDRAQSDSYVEVYGGLAVPFFVVVLAFIGGAVSLSRRVPEYQRRADNGYIPCDREPAMKAYQAREAVVFQIMQLTSAPFLAMATWYVISPATAAAAAALAFGTGFASEPLLLMIRGMVEGIRPEGARVPDRRAVELQGRVVARATGAAIADVEVQLTTADGAAPRSARTDSAGVFGFAGLGVGTVVKLVAADAGRRAERELTVTDKPSTVELRL